MDDRAVQQFLTGLIGRPMRYGFDDCILSAGALCAIVTGVNPVAPLAGRWSDRASALAFERSLPGTTRHAKAAALAGMLGLVAVDPLDAPIGAMGLVRGQRLEVAGARFSAGWFARSSLGFSVRRQAVLAWSCR